MELTALIMDNVTKKVKQFSLPVELEYVASEFESNSSDPKELLNAEFDDCSLYSDVSTDRELGQYIVEDMGVELSREQLERYLDYEKFGRDVRLEEGGSFVDKGYFVSR